MTVIVRNVVTFKSWKKLKKSRFPNKLKRKKIKITLILINNLTLIRKPQSPKKLKRVKLNKQMIKNLNRKKKSTKKKVLITM